MRIPKTKAKHTMPAIILAAVLIILTACAVYLGDYYPADPETAALLEDAIISEDGNLVFQPEQAAAGLIFYPGGKVDHRAYAPLMHELSSRGILCVLVEMPFRLAVLDVNAAKGIPEAFPQIDTWYIGGHSLGGSMAATHLSEHTDVFDALVLLGSYSTADLSETNLAVLSVYGSEDLVLNREKYNQYRENLPAGFREVIIDGGCHANFGMYGPQEGDGTPTITVSQQILLTADAISSLMDPEDAE